MIDLFLRPSRRAYAPTEVVGSKRKKDGAGVVHELIITEANNYYRPGTAPWYNYTEQKGHVAGVQLQVDANWRTTPWISR